MKEQELSKEQVKLIRSLHKKYGRDENKLFIAEGQKICSEILPSEYVPKFVVIPGNANPASKKLAEDIANKYSIKIYKTQRKIFDKICDAESPQDILLCVNIKNIDLNPRKSFIALDKISDPGNVGTIIRTAEWFGFEQILLSNRCADIYNPKTVRSSMGSIFKVDCLQNVDLIDIISKKFSEHIILGTFLDAKKYISEIETDNQVGIILGNESQGISKELEKIIDERVKIKGFGKIDSLNVSVAAGIVMYEIALKKSKN